MNKSHFIGAVCTVVLLALSNVANASYVYELTAGTSITSGDPIVGEGVIEFTTLSSDDSGASVTIDFTALDTNISRVIPFPIIIQAEWDIVGGVLTGFVDMESDLLIDASYGATLNFSTLSWGGQCASSSNLCGGGGDLSGFEGPLLIQAVPVPAAAWLFGSGLLGLVGFARRKKAA